ncbi:MAG: MCE family protein [Proteobacteria bacterium]|nr:MCE family protein [Pseudomonadota bacterium]
MAATRSQKIRLSVFLITTTAIVIATLLYLMGASMLQIRDEYTILLQGGSGGLEVGGQVRFNDINVGRIETVKIDPEDPSLIRITITLEHGTPITEDTIATPELAGITGSKRLALHGGTKNSKRLEPGSIIPSENTDLGAVITKVINIADKLENLIDNLVDITNVENKQKIDNILTEVETMTKSVNTLVASNEENINQIVGDVKDLVVKLDSSMNKVEHSLDQVDQTITKVASQHNINQITNILDTTNALMSNVTTRTSDEELGRTIQDVNKLVADTNVTVLRLRTDLQRVMGELESAVENINEFTQILIDNPSVLISGRTEKDRQLK